MGSCSAKFNKKLVEAIERHYCKDDLLRNRDVITLTTMRQACEYLQKLRYPNVIIEDKISIQKLLELDKFLYDDLSNHNEDVTDIFCKTELDIIFVDLLNNCYTNVKEFVQNIQQNEINKQKFMIIALLFDILWKLTDFSMNVRIRFHRQQGTKALLDYIVDDDFIRNLKLNSPNSTDEIVELIKDTNLLQSICGSLHNISKICDYYKFDFNQLQATSILFKFIKQNPSQLISIYLTIANVVNDKEIETIVEIKSIIKEIINLVRLITTSISTNVNLNRVKIDFMNKYSEFIAVVEYNETQWNLVELLEGLYRFSINDSIKYYIYEDMKFKEDAEKIMSNGNETERLFATKLLWQLCFDNRIVNNLISRDQKLYTLIVKLAAHKRVNILELNKNCENILWCIKKFSKSSDKISSKSNLSERFLSKTDNNDLILVPTQNELKFEKATDSQKVMISYQHESKDLCMKIKGQLESCNYKVIIDNDEIYGSTLQWMANAIETCDFMIICANEKYKQSSNCRAEAEYAFKLKKAVIPCIFQPHYIPDGWLGIIFGSKIYVDFASKTFNDAFISLEKQISLHSRSDVIESIPTTTKSFLSLKTTKNIEQNFKQSFQNKKVEPLKDDIKSWSVENVNKWLNEKCFDYRIKRQFQNCSGETLIKFYSTKTHAPGYFYSAISKNGIIETFRVFEFINELEILMV